MNTATSGRQEQQNKNRKVGKEAEGSKVKIIHVADNLDAKWVN